MDEAGNQGEFTSLAVKDKTTPAKLTVKTIKTGSKYVTGKTEPKAKIQVKNGSKTIGTGKADSKGNFKVKITKQAKGKKITIIASDAAKNTKTVSVKVK